jgi:hypothetical protein
MGSKVSKAVRRHPSRPDALASTPGSITTHKDCETRTRQALSLPEIKPLTPLVVDLQTTNAAPASTDNYSSPPAATTNNHITDPQPDTLTSILEPPTSVDAMDSLTRLLAADAQRLLDNMPAPPAPAPAPATPIAPPQDILPLPPPPPPQITEITCIICCEPGKFPKGKEHLAIKACKPCGSTYCAPCLKDMFVAASKDISRMPPRCCIQIPLYHAVPYLTKAEAAEFKSKYEEWSTPNPLYCPVPTCSTFIPNRLLPQAAKSSKQRIDSVIGTPTSPEIPCPKCSTDICTKCRQLAHPNQMCENLAFGVDEETAKLLKSWGYKRCPKCSNGVKRMFGCNHMECLCGAHWCWVCQKPNDECEGDCYEEDDEYSDGEDEEMDEVVETVEVTPPGNTEAHTTTGEPTTESIEVTVTIETAPPPAHRARNLDARSRGYWEDSGLDFGDEPTDNYADRAWNCDHRFFTTRVSFADSLRSGPSTTGIECTKCWNPVHPEIEMPNPVNNGGALVVAGTARGYTGRGRAPRGRGRGRGRGATFMAELVRGDATIGTETGDPLSGEMVIDTYGRTIMTTEFYMEPTRRASLHNVTELDTRPSSLTSDAWAKYSHSQHSGFEGTVDDTHTHSHSPFSFAYECHHCGIVVCNTCKSEALAEQGERDRREAARQAVLEAEREARQAEANRLYELERPEREAREAAERKDMEEQRIQQQVREQIEDERSKEELYENAWMEEVELPGILARREAERLRNEEMLARPENQDVLLGWLTQFNS